MEYEKKIKDLQISNINFDNKHDNNISGFTTNMKDYD